MLPFLLLACTSGDPDVEKPGSDDTAPVDTDPGDTDAETGDTDVETGDTDTGPDDTDTAPVDTGTDSGCTPVAGFADVDGDGFGDPAAPVLACPGEGFSPDGTDCDDADPAAHPGAREDWWDGDLDCDGVDPACAEGAPTWRGDVWVRSADDAASLCRTYGTVDGDLRIQREAADVTDLTCLCEVTGTLSIHGGALASLVGLEGLARVGEIEIYDEPLLVSLDGLDGLTEVGTVELDGLPLLADIDALAGITELDSVRLWDLPLLDNVDGLANLTRLGGLSVLYTERLAVLDLPALVDLGDVALRVNDALVEVPAMAAFSTGTVVYITDNPNLATLPDVGASALEILILQDNALTSVSAFSALTSVGNLRIHEPGVTDLTPLAGITGFVWEINLEGTGAPDLGGMRPDEVVAVSLAGNHALTTLAGLEGATVWEVELEDNDALVDVSALTNVVGGDYLDHLHIIDNDALTSLDGLGGAAILSGLVVSQNDVLVDLAGLADAITSVDDIAVEANPLLPTSSAEALCATLGPTTCTVSGNAP